MRVREVDAIDDEPQILDATAFDRAVIDDVHIGCTKFELVGAPTHSLPGDLGRRLVDAPNTRLLSDVVLERAVGRTEVDGVELKSRNVLAIDLDSHCVSYAATVGSDEGESIEPSVTSMCVVG